MTRRSTPGRAASIQSHGAASTRSSIGRGQILCVAQCPVDDQDMLEIALHERVDDCARRPACADDERQSPAIVPSRRRFVQVPMKARDVGVVAPEEPILAPQRIDGAERFRDGRAAIASGEGRHLVRNRDVRADQAVLSDPRRELGERAGRHRKPFVAGVVFRSRSSQNSWIIGERECSIGQPATPARMARSTSS